ncbi:MAG: SDR family oxidoreductase [Chloroflexi bacterium]|nr:MAG: SDR family oxidoreductase [Chloroflexota bacterium]
MADRGCVVVVGGTSGLGKAVARHFAQQGAEVIVSGRDAQRAASVARELGGRTRGIGFDLAEPSRITGALGGVGKVDHLVLAAIERDENKVRDFNTERALRLVTLKLVGYTEVIHALVSGLKDDSSILLFGGGAKDKPYPGSTMVTTVNAAVTGLVRALVMELAPVRVNAIHPGIVGDSPYWSAKPAPVLEGHRSKTPTGRLPTMADILDAALFLLTNRSVNGINLAVDGGWHFMTW